MGEKVDYIIVGGGLAGTCLALQLNKAGKQIALVQGNFPSASKAAGGLFNPITGRNMVKTWMADQLFPYLKEFYGYYEKLWETQFLHFLPIYKPFPSFEDQNTFMSQSSENAYQGFLDDKVNHQKYQDYIFNEKLGFQTLHSGFMDVTHFLETAHTHLNKECTLRFENLSADDLEWNDHGLVWKDLHADAIIFCEGMNSLQNSLFSKVPLNASKGEVLQVSIQNFTDEVIFNKQVFMVPTGNSEYKVGSTYYWKFEDEKPSDQGYKELTEKLAEMIRPPFQVTKHWAGIRPASRDRRPYLGQHPVQKNAYIFNGLGAKGVSLAPYFSHIMKDFIINGIEPESSVNITRLKSLYSHN